MEYGQLESYGPDPGTEGSGQGGSTGLQGSVGNRGLCGRGAGGGESSYPERPTAPDCVAYERTGFCMYGQRCRFNHPRGRGKAYKVGRIIGEYYPARDGRQAGGGEPSYPERSGEPNCMYYMRTGLCKFGKMCRFNHPRDRGEAYSGGRTIGADYRAWDGQPLCQYYMRTGSCKFGFSCKYNHSRPDAASAAAVKSSIYPYRPGNEECAYYLRTGQCKFGNHCIFHHPLPTNVQISTPTSTATPPIPTAAVLYPTGKSSATPPQYGVPAGSWEVARPPVMPGSYIQVPYGPSGVVCVPASSASSASRLSAKVPAGATGPISSTTSPPKVPSYPERPVQAECQHYMRTGECKYSSSCGYNHPTERTTQRESFTLTPIGLPFCQLRDGDQDSTFTVPPPPPPPPPLSFHQKSGPLSACRILRKGGFDSQGNEYSVFEKTHEDQVPDLIVPSNELGEISKGILFLLSEGYEFESEKLIQLWMAAGFMKDEPMEIIGATYFEKLMSEGYILLCDLNSLYKVNAEALKSDLCMIQDKSKYLILESTSQQIAEPEDIFHVSVACDDINDAIFKTLDKFKDLRTLLFHGSCGSRPEQVLDLFLGFKSLSILDLSGTDIKELPSSVGKMVHLKYLDLSWTLVEFLPESMSRLQRLQSLKLKGCSRLRRLPREIKMLTELRHLDFNILGQLTAMPKGLGALVKLRTLSAFLVGSQEGFNIRELRELNNLTGEFCIARLENVKSGDDAKWASITTKNRLKKLELRWSDFPLRDLKNEVVDDSVLKNLRPHSELEELLIRCYAGKKLPSWIADVSFDKLARITLFKCEHAFMLPSMQKLPSLEYLELISLNSLVKLDFRGETEIGLVAFPRLRRLIIDEMLILESWTQAEEGDFPCLVELTIKDCPKLSELPSLVNLSSVKRLELSSCPQVQLLPDTRLSASLEFLIVEDCPLIRESCWEQGGQEWEVIRHVPNVWIDQEAIFEQTDDDSDVLIADEIMV